MKRLLTVTMCSVMALSLSGCLGATTVEPGHTGVKKTLGSVETAPLTPGFYFYNPFITSIIDMDTQIQKFEDKANIYTKDVQQVDVRFAINYNLLPEDAVKIYSTIGEDYQNVLIPQVVNGVMKNVIGKWDAMELVENRSKASAEIEEQIGTELAKNGLVVTGFQLTDLKFQKDFEDAVESKVQAIQKAEQAKNQTVQVQEQAKQTVISAQADAEAMKIKADALKQSQTLVMYEAVKKWDGVLPQMINGTGSNLFMQLPEFAAKEKDTENK